MSRLTEYYARQYQTWLAKAARGTVHFNTHMRYWDQATLDAAKRGAQIVWRGLSDPGYMTGLYRNYHQTRGQLPIDEQPSVNQVSTDRGMVVFNQFVQAGYRDTVTLSQFNHALDIEFEMQRRAGNRSFNITAVVLAASFFGAAYLAQTIVPGAAAAATEAPAVAVTAPVVAVASPVVSIGTLASGFSAAIKAVKGFSGAAGTIYSGAQFVRTYNHARAAQRQVAAQAAAAVQQDNALRTALAQKAAAQASLDRQQNIGTPSPPSWVKLAIVAAPLSLFFM